MTIIHDITHEPQAGITSSLTYATAGVIGVIDGPVVINIVLNESQLEELGTEVYQLLAAMRARKAELAIR
jgi:hypothetical protein